MVPGTVPYLTVQYGTIGVDTVMLCAALMSKNTTNNKYERKGLLLLTTGTVFYYNFVLDFSWCVPSVSQYVFCLPPLQIPDPELV
jgi:hypothetical protein